MDRVSILKKNLGNEVSSNSGGSRFKILNEEFDGHNESDSIQLDDFSCDKTNTRQKEVLVDISIVFGRVLVV
ncbi:hypothetical protein ACOSQ3_027548 [Xanthoceras sorbifolium]